jgi:hypothetical protein
MNLPITFTCRAERVMDALKDIQVGCTPTCGFWYMGLHSPKCEKFSEADVQGWSRAQDVVDALQGK